MQQLTLYTLDGNNHLGRIKSAGFNIDLQTEDVSSGSASDEFAYETKRSSSHDFELIVENGSGSPMTSAQIATETVGGASRLGFCKSFSVSVSSKTDDGSGHGDLDTCPVALKRKVTGSLRELVPLTEATPELLGLANSGTPADRQVTVDLDFGAKRTTFPALLTGAKHSMADGSLDTIDAKFEKRGAMTSPSSGTDIYAVAFIGDGLLTVIATKNNGTVATTYTATGVVTSLTVTVEDGRVVKATGTIEIQGPMVVTEV